MSSAPFLILNCVYLDVLVLEVYFGVGFVQHYIKLFVVRNNSTLRILQQNYSTFI